MKLMKKRLALFLCLVLAVPTLLGVLPQAKLEAQAASSYFMYWSGFYSNDSTPDVRVKKGTKNFYIGDYIYAYKEDETVKGYLSTLKGAKYSSNKSSVASINKTTGLISPKKTGTATITISFKGMKLSCKVKVVSSVGSTVYKSTASYAEKFIKAYGKGIKTNNRYKIINALRLYEDKRNNEVYNNANFYTGVESSTSIKNGKLVYKYIVKQPALAHAYALSDVVNNYKAARNPIGTQCSKTFNSISISGKANGNTISVKLKSKVTADQIFGIKAVTSEVWDNYIASSNKATFPVYVRDTKTGHRYYAIATATKGSNKLTIKTSTLKLKSGRKYKLEELSSYSFRSDWTSKGKVTFTAK